MGCNLPKKQNIDASKYSENYSTHKNILSKIINIFKKRKISKLIEKIEMNYKKQNI